MILSTGTGCATASRADYCLVYQPIYLTKAERAALADDGAELVIDGDNAAYLELCDA